MLENLCSKYIENLKQFSELINYSMPIDFSKEQIIEKIQDNSKKQRMIKTEQNDLLQLILVPFENKEKTLDEESSIVLEKFANDLSKARRDLDNAIALRCHKLLLEYQINRDDINGIIKEIYWCGICSWKYYTISPIDYECKYFKDVYKYQDRLGELDSEGLRFYVSCLINQLLGYTNKDATPLIQLGNKILSEIEIIEEKYSSKFNFSIEAYKSVIYRNMLTVDSSFLKGVDLTKENTHRAYELAEKCIQLIEFKDQTAIPYETVYLYDLYFARFYDGLDDKETLFKNMDSLVTPNDKYSDSENYNRVFFYTAKYLELLAKFSDDTASVELKGRKLIERAIEYAKKLKFNDESAYVNKYLFELIKVSFNVLPIYLVQEMLINVAMFQHKPTYIHTMVVKMISITILEYVLNHKPELLEGILDNYSLDDVKEHKDRLMRMMKEMAVLHDLGKYKIVNIITNASRNLEDEEFEAIKLHPSIGYEMVKNARLSQVVKDGILYHHRYHDGKGGYPLENIDNTNNQTMVDILSLADSIDAATDYLGRTYYLSKTLDQLIEEFKEYSDTRYSKNIIEIIEVPEVKAKIQDILDNYRINLLCAVYTNKVDVINGTYEE